MFRPRLGSMGFVHGSVLGPRRLLRGIVVRLGASFALVTGGLVFVVLYLGFFAVRYAWYTNLAVVLSATILVPVLLVAMWVLWGLGMSRRYLRGV